MAGGFTTIELVAAIALVGILSVSVGSRFFAQDSFETSVAASQVRSVARYSQRVALSRQAASIELRVIRSGNDWQVRTVENVSGTLTTLHEAVLGGSDSGIAVTAGIGPTTLTAGTDLVLSYDALGNATDITIGGVSGDTSDGVSITVTGGSTQLLCVSPVGYAHDGACI